MAAARPDGLDDVALLDRIAAAEQLKGTLAALQARDSAALELLRVAQDADRGVRAEDRGKGTADEIALARSESPSRGAGHLRLARALTGDLSSTMRRLASGEISEWRATLIEREAHPLAPGLRRKLDREVSADPARMAGWGDRRVAGVARAVAARLDVAAVVAKSRRAAGDRRVWIRPAPDTMTYLTALLPVAAGVACYAALRRAADTAPADGRGHGSVMADTLVQRVTGQAAAAVPIAVQLVISDAALLGRADDPARIPGYGPVPAAVARHLVAGSAADRSATLRRLYAGPLSGALTAMESRQRHFPAGLAEFIDLRDDTCRTPFCDAPIRHHDHVIGHAAGGPTSAANAQGLCEHCNYAKEFTARAVTATTAAGSPLLPGPEPRVVSRPRAPGRAAARGPSARGATARYGTSARRSRASPSPG